MDVSGRVNGVLEDCMKQVPVSTKEPVPASYEGPVPASYEEHVPASNEEPTVVVPYCYLFLLSVFILWFSYYVSDIFCGF